MPYYLKIPLPYLATPAEDQEGQAGFDRKVAKITADIEYGRLPHWAMRSGRVGASIVEEWPDDPPADQDATRENG